MRRKLWYRHPAAKWMDGLLIGTGRLAGTIFGDGQGERLGLNHELLYSAKYRERECDPASIKHLSKIREHLWKKEYYEATSLARRTYSFYDGTPGRQRRIDDYKPAGELVILPDCVENRDYIRWLDLDTALAGVSYDGVCFDYVADSVQDKIIVHITGTLSAKVDVEFQPDADLKTEVYRSEKAVRAVGEYAGGHSFESRISIFTDGFFDGCRLTVEKEAYLIVDIETGLDGAEAVAGRLDARAYIPVGSFAEMIAPHVEKYRSYMERLVLELEEDTGEDIPTDERMAIYRKGSTDLTLIKMYFDFGHYLLYSGSVCGMMPLNLQGKWNNMPNPPWFSDYHGDINTQMFYWSVEAAGMGDFHLPLFEHLEHIMPQARKAARTRYGCRGIFMGLQEDRWGRATVESSCCNVWPGVAAWYGEHFFRHYEYTHDTIFLRERAYPYMKEVCAFFEDYLIADKEGILQILPSQSPENTFVYPGREEEWLGPSVCISSAMDISLVHEIFTNTIKAAEILSVDEEKVELWKRILDKLQPLRIGGDGRLLEWNEEFAEREPGHRHLSQLYGVYPGGFINEKDTPELFEASKKSYDYRVAHGSGNTGWSSAWCMALDARFGRGNETMRHIKELIRDFSTESLLDLCPYSDKISVFQIDGNLGCITGILEMLVRVNGERVKLLPALSEELRNGSVRGLRLPGGAVCDLAWKDGVLTFAEITLGVSGSVLLEGSYTVSEGVPEGDGYTRIVGEPGTKIMLINIFMSKIQEKNMKKSFSE